MTEGVRHHRDCRNVELASAAMRSSGGSTPRHWLPRVASTLFAMTLRSALTFAGLVFLHLTERV